VRPLHFIPDFLNLVLVGMRRRRRRRQQTSSWAIRRKAWWHHEGLQSKGIQGCGLASRVPPKRRDWTSEYARMDIFDAVELALVFMLKQAKSAA